MGDSLGIVQDLCVFSHALELFVCWFVGDVWDPFVAWVDIHEKVGYKISTLGHNYSTWACWCKFSQ